MDVALTEANQKIEDALHYFKMEMAGIRAGRANPSLIENIPVDVYGGRMKLIELGNISAPQPSLLTVQIWDVSILQNVIKAIQSAGIGLNPSNEGTLIRLPIPALTAERREEFIKLLHQKMEESRIKIRQIREDVLRKVQSEVKAKTAREDDLFRAKEELQKITDDLNKKIDDMTKKKEQELMTS